MGIVSVHWRVLLRAKTAGKLPMAGDTNTLLIKLEFWSYPQKNLHDPVQFYCTEKLHLSQPNPENPLSSQNFFHRIWQHNGLALKINSIIRFSDRLHARFGFETA